MFQFIHDNLDFSHKVDRASSPHDEYWKHMHYFYEVFYFISGDATYTVDSSVKKLEKGDLIIIHPGRFHFATVNRNVLYERYVFKFPEEAIPASFREKLQNSGTFFTLSGRLLNLLTSMDEICGKFSEEETSILFMNHIQDLLIYLLQNEKAIQKVADNPISSNIIKYIDDNITENLSLKKIAEALNYSPSYLSNIFKQNLKTPIMQYIRTKKMIFARNLLKRGTTPEQTAEMLHFDDYSTFYRSYCKVIGESPSKTRKNI